jgi:hypothetical protein
MVNNKFESVWKEAGIAFLKVTAWYFPGETEENHKKPQSRKSVSQPRSEPSTF